MTHTPSKQKKIYKTSLLYSPLACTDYNLATLLQVYYWFCFYFDLLLQYTYKQASALGESIYVKCHQQITKSFKHGHDPYVQEICRKLGHKFSLDWWFHYLCVRNFYNYINELAFRAWPQCCDKNAIQTYIFIIFLNSVRQIHCLHSKNHVSNWNTHTSCNPHHYLCPVVPSRSEHLTFYYYYFEALRFFLLESHYSSRLINWFCSITWQYSLMVLI